MESHLLKSKEFLDSHTAKNIVEELEGTFQEWDLSTDKLMLPLLITVLTAAINKVLC